MSQARNCLILLWAFFECLLFSGLLYGWSSLVYVLIDSGIYSHLCPNASEAESHNNFTQRTENCSANASTGVWSCQNVSLDGGGEAGRGQAGPGRSFSCKEQESVLAMIYAVAINLYSFFNAATGHLQYKCGTRLTRILTICSFCTGMVILAFLDQDAPWLVFFGILLVGVGGLPVFMTNTQLSVLFGHGASTVVGCLAGAMDASSSGFLYIKLAHENGVPRKYSCLAVAVLYLLMLGLSTFLWMPRMHITTSQEALVVVREVESDDNVRPDSSMIKNTHKASGKKREELVHVLTGEVTSLRQCVTSRVYVLHVLWMALLSLSFSFALTAFTPLFARRLHGDKLRVSHFTSALQYTMLAGLVTSPMSGCFYDVIRKSASNETSRTRRVLLPAAVPLALTSALGAATMLSLLASLPEVLYLTFALFVLFRSFLYGFGAAFLSTVFPMEYFGTLYGINLVTTGIISLVIYALVAWANTFGFTQVLGFLGTVNLVTFLHPLLLWWQCRHKEA